MMKFTLAAISASLCLLVVLMVTPVSGAGFEEALAAHQRGEYSRAFQRLRSLSEEGDAKAQVLLGKMYQYGEGVSPDLVEAYKWYTIADKKGMEDGAYYRNKIVPEMMPAQVSKARRLVREWQETHKKK